MFSTALANIRTVGKTSHFNLILDFFFNFAFSHTYGIQKDRFHRGDGHVG